MRNASATAATAAEVAEANDSAEELALHARCCLHNVLLKLVMVALLIEPDP
jgi:hypothetical protein